MTAALSALAELLADLLGTLPLDLPDSEPAQARRIERWGLRD